MPFDFDDYQQKCNRMTKEELHKEWENYTREISGGAASTATSVLLSPLTAGVSLVGLGLSAPRIHNARKKREIIEAGLQARGTVHHTRKRDVVAPIALSGTVTGLTLGLAPGDALEKTYAYYSRKNSEGQENLQQQAVQEQMYLQNWQPVFGEHSGLQNTRPGLHTSQIWPQDPAQGPPDGQRHGYEPTPGMHHDIALSTPTSTTSGLQDIYERIEDLQLQQDLSGYELHPPAPHLGVHTAQTWPLNFEGITVTDPKLLAAVGKNRANAAREQNKSDQKGAKKGTFFTSQMQIPESPQDSQYLPFQPEAPPAYKPSQKLSRALSVKSIVIDSGNGNPPTKMTAEQEILFLRGRLLQLEMKNRGDENPAYSPDQRHVQQQTAQVQVLVQDELGRMENPGNNKVHSDPSTTLQFWSQSPEEQTVSLPAPPQAAGHPPRPQSAQIPLSTIQEAQSYQHQPQPLPTHPKQNPNPRRRVGSTPQTVSTSFQEALSAVSTPQLTFAVAESQTLPVAPDQQKDCPPPPEPQEPSPLKKRQDSGYYSIDLTPTPYSPAPPSFGLPPTAEIFEEFAPPSFGLPPTISSSAVTGQEEIDSRSTVPSMSQGPRQSDGNSQSSMLAWSLQVTGQGHRESLPSMSHTPTSPQVTRQEHRYSEPWLPHTSQIVGHRESQSVFPPMSPQPTAQRQESQASLFPMSPPYYPPPSSVADVGVEREGHFNQKVQVAPPILSNVNNRQSIAGIQGWQWVN